MPQLPSRPPSDTLRRNLVLIALMFALGAAVLSLTQGLLAIVPLLIAVGLLIASRFVARSAPPR